MNVNQSEKDRIYQWACENDTRELQYAYFIKFGEECRSCFEKRPYQSGYCREYMFHTMPQLRNELDEMWEDNEIMGQIKKAMLVASMKGKSREEEKNNGSKEERKEQISPYIYNF